MTQQPFHIVDKRPWPLTSSLSSLFLTGGLINLLYTKTSLVYTIGIMALALSAFQWWRDISREARLQGHHSKIVLKRIQWGIVLFILSEIIFFRSFFWTFFHSRLAPAIEAGSVWPPTGLQAFNPFQIPLLNTAILLSSGATVTWRHFSILNNKYKTARKALSATICLGIYFTALQGFEYYQAPFSIRDSVYGSVFFIATGFHGAHVIIGTAFLIVSWLRAPLLSTIHHFGFEAAAWYWHFVDVVWLFLYSLAYWWTF